MSTDTTEPAPIKEVVECRGTWRRIEMAIVSATLAAAGTLLAMAAYSTLDDILSGSEYASVSALIARPLGGIGLFLIAYTWLPTNARLERYFYRLEKPVVVIKDPDRLDVFNSVGKLLFILFMAESLLLSPYNSETSVLVIQAIVLAWCSQRSVKILFLAIRRRSLD